MTIMWVPVSYVFIVSHKHGGICSVKRPPLWRSRRILRDVCHSPINSEHERTFLYKWCLRSGPGGKTVSSGNSAHNTWKCFDRWCWACCIKATGGQTVRVERGWWEAVSAGLLPIPASPVHSSGEKRSWGEETKLSDDNRCSLYLSPLNSVASKKMKI